MNYINLILTLTNFSTNNCFSLWFLPEFEPRVFLADVIKILHKSPVNESIIFGLILSCGRFSSLSESSVSLEDSILFWKSNCLFTSHFLILATPLFSILSGLVLSLTELHQNEIARGQWTPEKDN
jgi:hypothetical protein